jgi:hypothetical protein
MGSKGWAVCLVGSWHPRDENYHRCMCVVLQQSVHSNHVTAAFEHPHNAFGTCMAVGDSVLVL